MQQFADSNAQIADANPDGTVNWATARNSGDALPPTNAMSSAGTEQLSEDLPTPEQVQAAQTANAPAPAQPQAGPLPTTEQMRANRNMPEAPVPPATTQPPARQSAEAPPTNAVAEVLTPKPTPKPQYRDTPRYANPQDAMKALDDPNLDEAGRREAAGTIVSSQMANIPAADRAMFRQIANGENGPEQQAFLAKGFDRFQQEQATEAVKTNPELATNPEAFGSFMGQVQGMWEGLGPVGQIASMIGIPAAVFGMMGGDGMSAILGGLGLGALGIGAGAMGYLGEGTQRNMGQMLGQVGNFFGVIPDEARNASILTGNNDEAKQRIRAAMESAPAGQGFAAGQQALNAERAKFEPLKQLYDTRPELAHTMMMGMEGAAPKTPAEAEAIYQRLRQQYDETGREGYLQQQAYDEGAKQVSEVQNALPPWARVAAGVAAPYMPEGVRGYMQDIGGDPAAVARRHVDQRFGGTPELVKANAAQAIWRRHVVKQALNAVDQKELNDLEQWQKTTKVFDEKKVQRLKELQARQAAEFSADKVVKVCMKAARCWAGYEAVPGAKAYSRGSCRPVGSKKTQKEMKNGTERQHEKVKQSGAQSRPQVTNRTTQGARAFTAARLGAARY